MNLKKILTTDLGGPRIAAVECPHCQTALQFHPELDGQTAACPECKGLIEFHAPSEHELALAALKEKRRRATKLPATICYITGAVLLLIAWPLGILLLAIGLIITAINSKAA